VVDTVEVSAMLPAVFKPAAGDLRKLTGPSESRGAEGVYFGRGRFVVVDDVPETTRRAPVFRVWSAELI